MNIGSAGKPRKPLSASEALFGFGGWLTSRDKAVTLSRSHEAGIMARLIDVFCKTNELEEPRNHWEENLTHPKIKVD